MIPGGQALLGFQFVATLTKSFDALPLGIKWLHVSSLAAVSLSVLLLMTPAALHRLAFHGEDNPQFFIIGSRLVIAAALPLALGISGDISVVVFKITESGSVSAAVGVAAAAVFLSAWYLYPSLAVIRKRCLPVLHGDRFPRLIFNFQYGLLARFPRDANCCLP
ncbi:DUF6328 family protein [Bradyrhizobium sp. URHC0002]